MVLVQCTASAETMWHHGSGSTIPQPSQHEATLVSLAWINQWKVNVSIRFSEMVQQTLSGLDGSVIEMQVQRNN